MKQSFGISLIYTGSRKLIVTAIYIDTIKSPWGIPLYIGNRMLEVMKCNVCGKIVMVVHNGAGNSVCCNQPMELQTEKSDDQGNEKHLPVTEKSNKGVIIKVGSVPHPMEGEHYIEWIEVISGNYLYVKGLQPGDKPEAEFPVSSTDVKVRSYCNKHGLWSNKPKKH